MMRLLRFGEHLVNSFVNTIDVLANGTDQVVLRLERSLRDARFQCSLDVVEQICLILQAGRHHHVHTQFM